MFDFRLFRKPTFAGAQIVAFTISSSMFAMFLYLTLYIQNVLALLADPGRPPLPAALAALVRVAPIAGRLIDAHSGAHPVRRRDVARRRSRSCSCTGSRRRSGWTHLLPGFIVGGIGIGLVNAPLASTAVGVVEPRRAGMASGINNTFRQVGIATGIAGLGAIFQHKIHGSDRVAFVSAMNAILIVAAIVAFVGAAAGVALVRGRDFVRSQPPAAGA